MSNLIVNTGHDYNDFNPYLSSNFGILKIAQNEESQAENNQNADETDILSKTAEILGYDWNDDTVKQNMIVFDQWYSQFGPERIMQGNNIMDQFLMDINTMGQTAETIQLKSNLEASKGLITQLAQNIDAFRNAKEQAIELLKNNADKKQEDANSQPNPGDASGLGNGTMNNIPLQET